MDERLEAVFHSALERHGVDRERYLQEACNGDVALREEVESLLKAHAKPGILTEIPAHEIGALLIEAEDRDLREGQMIDEHFKIVRLLGAGGMGKVYLAQDVKLERLVALKLLSGAAARGPEAIARFKQEARAASALNHVNAITIYEVGEEGRHHFIATEYVDGVTLREYLRAHPELSWDETLNIALQVASALEAAHGKNLIHRDIKPENVMRRQDGVVKVLDFGLAKFTQRHLEGADLGATTMMTTSPGIVMGTVTHMSPEQVRGRELDVRTDIWSFGVVLYELATRKLPFAGETKGDVIANILSKEPAPITEYVPNAPLELQRIIAKCLRKEREQRYSSAAEIAADVQSLRAKLKSAHAAPTAPQTPPRGTADLASGGTRSGPNVRTTLEETYGYSLPTNAVTSVPTGRTERPGGATWRKIAVAASVCVALGVGAGAWASFNPKHPIVHSMLPSWMKKAPEWKLKEMKKLTQLGNVTRACISPDGQFVAYATREDDGRESVWVKQMGATTANQIAPPIKGEMHGVTISTQNIVYYVAIAAETEIGTVYAVPVLGGVPRKIIEDVDSPVTLSPDGRQMAFIRGSAEGDTPYTSLTIADIDGGNVRTLAKKKASEGFTLRGPAWSPDGKTIVNAAEQVSPNGEKCQYVAAISVADGSETKLLASKNWDRIDQIAWVNDGEGLAIPFAEKDGSGYQVAHVAYPSGDALRRITNDVARYQSMSAKHDSNVLVAMQRLRASSVGLTEVSDSFTGEGKQITQGVGGYAHVAWITRNQIAYVSNESGNESIWISDIGGSRRQLTFNGKSDQFPTASPDGQYVIFSSNRDGAYHLWRLNLKDGELKQLTNGEEDIDPQCSPDGKWVVYTSGNVAQSLLRVPLAGGAPERLMDGYARFASVSPDGKWIACQFGDATLSGSQGVQVGILPATGGKPVKTFPIPATDEQVIRWSADGKSLFYIDKRDGVENIWAQPIDGRTPKRVTDFASDRIFSFSVSLDGKRIAWIRGSRTQDVVALIRAE
jgi:serine/threonine protein kinase/Tol biopolymer transport system component